MIITVDELVADLKVLRQRRALEAPDLISRINDRVRVVFDLDHEATIREQLSLRIRELAEPLPDYMREAVLIAYGLTEDSRERTFNDRVKLLATRIGREERTAVRRIDDGLKRIAQAAIAQRSDQYDGQLDPAPPWRTTALRTWVVLDRGAPEIYELRRVAGMLPALNEIELEYSVPVPPDPTASVSDKVRIDVLYGGELSTRLRRSRTRMGFVLRLPRRMSRDEPHEFLLRFAFPDADTMSNFYCCTPRYPCGRFDLHVRFGPKRPPEHLWKINGLFPTEINDHLAPREPIDADAAGEAHLVFTGLVPNLSYGAVWSPSVDSPGAEPAEPADEQQEEHQRLGEQYRDRQ